MHTKCSIFFFFSWERRKKKKFFRKRYCEQKASCAHMRKHKVAKIIRKKRRKEKQQNDGDTAEIDKDRKQHIPICNRILYTISIQMYFDFRRPFFLPYGLHTCCVRARARSIVEFPLWYARYSKIFFHLLANIVCICRQLKDKISFNINACAFFLHFRSSFYILLHIHTVIEHYKIKRQAQEQMTEKERRKKRNEESIGNIAIERKTQNHSLLFTLQRSKNTTTK